MPVYIPPRSGGSGGGGGGPISAGSVSYSPITSGISATNVQNAIDILDNRIDINTVNIGNLQTNVTYLNSVTSSLSASTVSLSAQVIKNTTNIATISGSVLSLQSTVGALSATDASLQSQINNLFAVGSRLVFRETFTGDGVNNVFTLNGSIGNAGFSVGSWSSANLLVSLTADVTNPAGKPIYDGTLPFLRHRIYVNSITTGGAVTLDYIPQNGQQFYVWYWYQLTSSDVLSYYEREDHVAAMEEDAGDLATEVDVNTQGFSNIVLRSIDNTVQKSLDRLDSYLVSISGMSGGSGGGSNISQSVIDSITGSIANLQEINKITVEPTGFENLTDSNITFDSSSLLFTLTPSISSFNYWVHGDKHTVTQAITATLPAISGTYFLYFDNNGSFTTSYSTPWDLSLHAPIALVHIGASSSSISGALSQYGWLCEERHGVVMDWATHRRLHLIEGTQVVTSNGSFNAFGFQTSPTTSSISANTFGISGGMLLDEDLGITVPTLPDGGPYTICYRTGPSGVWNSTTNSTLPWIPSNSSPIEPSLSGNFIAYNQFTGSTWKMTDAGGNRYVNYFVCAVNSASGYPKIILIPGQTSQASLSFAQLETILSLDLSGLPFQEIAPLYQVSYRTSGGFTDGIPFILSTPLGRGRIEGFLKIIGTRITTTSSTNSHTSLSNRTDAGSHPANAISFTPAISSNWIDPTVVDVNAALNNIANNVVYTSRNQSISGDKTFVNNVIINGKLTVDGLIDPTGLVLTPVSGNPDGPNTLWINSQNGNLIYHDQKPLLNSDFVTTVSDISGNLQGQITSNNNNLQNQISNITGGNYVLDSRYVSKNGDTMSGTLQITGNISEFILNGAVLATTNIGPITTNAAVDEFFSNRGNCCFWDVLITDNATNFRASRFMSVWNSSTGDIRIVETSTESIGNTDGISLIIQLILSNTKVRLIASVTSGTWYIKAIRKLL